MSSFEAAQLTPLLIVDASQAAALIGRFQRAPRLAFDTEGDGMFRYRARLCMMQLAFGDEVALVDTLALDGFSPWTALLGPEGPEKIVHDASFDARMLFAEGVCLGRVFDTAVAARFLGLKATGLSSLLGSFFGIALPKDKQRADWGKRPLDEDALRYLVDDVRYLERLADILLEKVRAQDIEAEVREECAYVLREAQTAPIEVPPWTRVRGAALKPPQERARLHELFREREALARELDVPPGRLVPNDLLARLAQFERVSEEELAQKLGSRHTAYVSRFREALERAEQRADAPAHEVAAELPRPPSPAELERRKLRRRWLTEMRAKESAARGVDPQVVLPGHCLNALVELPTLDLPRLREVPGFGECRVERYGRSMVSELTAKWSS